MSGIIGQFFRSFAVVVTFGVLVSLFVSLTLTPMLCSRFLKVKEKGMHHGRVHHWIEARFAKLDAFYIRVVAWALGHRWKVVFATLIAVGSSVFFFSAVGKTFAPEQDEGRFLFYLRTPLGSSIDYTDTRLKLVEEVLKTHTEIHTEFALIGLGTAGQVNQGTVVARMVPK